MAKFYYGGQAVVEGVMMRGRRQATVCVRRHDGEIITRNEALTNSLYGRHVVKLPFVRGLVMIWEMLVLGMKVMLFSVNVQARANTDKDIPKPLIAGMLMFSLTFAIGLFFVLPLLLAGAGTHIVHGTVADNAVEGIVRLSLFIGYLALVGRMARMRRVFQYHGAEHKTVNAFEHGAELSPPSVQTFSTVHVRCGTAFLLWVVVLSIFTFSLLGHPPLLVGILARIVLVPVIAAISYEILRFGARFYHVTAVRVLLQPGLWLQRLTTREPSDDQVEVAIMALRSVLLADGVQIPASDRVRGGVLQAARATT